MSCSFLGSTDGALAVFSNFVFLSSAGTVSISNDDAGVHTLSVAPISELVSPVGGVDLSGPMALSPSLVSGVNAGAGFTGTDSTGKSVVLTLAGSDTLRLGVTGTLDATAGAGQYQARAIITCI